VEEVTSGVTEKLKVSDPSEILVKLQSKRILRRIREMYGKLSQDHNDLSVMLWHGPRLSQTDGWRHLRERVVIGRMGSYTRYIDACTSDNGTLLTGDIPLSLDFSAIERHFANKW
jgi:hypothetical protein